MYIMYVDESGDVGRVNSPSKFFVLTGLVLPEEFWDDMLGKLIEFRKNIRDKYGLKLREEFTPQK